MPAPKVICGAVPDENGGTSLSAPSAAVGRTASMGGIRVPPVGTRVESWGKEGSGPTNGGPAGPTRRGFRAPGSDECSWKLLTMSLPQNPRRTPRDRPRCDGDDGLELYVGRERDVGAAAVATCDGIAVGRSVERHRRGGGEVVRRVRIESVHDADRDVRRAHRESLDLRGHVAQVARVHYG